MRKNIKRFTCMAAIAASAMMFSGCGDISALLENMETESDVVVDDNTTREDVNIDDVETEAADTTDPAEDDFDEDFWNEEYVETVVTPQSVPTTFADEVKDLNKDYIGSDTWFVSHAIPDRWTADITDMQSNDDGTMYGETYWYQDGSDAAISVETHLNHGYNGAYDSIALDFYYENTEIKEIEVNGVKYFYGFYKGANDTNPENFDYCFKIAADLEDGDVYSVEAGRYDTQIELTLEELIPFLHISTEKVEKFK